MNTIVVKQSETEGFEKPVRAIYCIGKNYLRHIQEMQSKIPDAPVVFLKPPSAIVSSEVALDFPSEKGTVHHEVELVLHVAKTGRRIDKTVAWNHVDAYGLGIDFTLRDLQSDLKEKCFPWLMSKGFDHSAALTSFLPIERKDTIGDLEFWLEVNGTRRQTAHTGDMIFDIPTLITFISRTITLQKGDLIFTGTPSGVGAVRSRDEVKVGISNVLEDTFHIK